MAEQAAILTIEAASPGGVPALVDTLYALLARLGRTPVVYHAQFAAGQMSAAARILHTLHDWKPRAVEERGMRTVLVPAPPVPLWLFYAAPHFLFGPLLGQYGAVFVVSGSAHVALPLAARGIPYTLWIATLYEDELKAKAAVGDVWARGVLSSPTWPLLAWQERFVLRRADRILTLSYHTAERIRQAAPQAADRIETALFPVDTARLKPDPAARERSPYGRYLLLAARINDPRKNVSLLLRAFARVRAQHPDLRLVLVGEEPGSALRDLAASLGLGEDVLTFGGIVSDDDLLQLYQGAELFVLPSRQEGLGIVMLEAMACGTPVVATRCGGPEGIVRDGETGYLVDEMDDPQPLAQAILDLLGDPGLAAMRERCAAFAAEHCARPVVEQQLLDAYEAVSAAAPAPSRLRTAVAALWSVAVLVAYAQHQIAIHGLAIQTRILAPLLHIIQ